MKESKVKKIYLIRRCVAPVKVGEQHPEYPFVTKPEFLYFNGYLEEAREECKKYCEEYGMDCFLLVAQELEDEEERFIATEEQEKGKWIPKLMYKHN